MMPFEANDRVVFKIPFRDQVMYRIGRIFTVNKCVLYNGAWYVVLDDKGKMVYNSCMFSKVNDRKNRITKLYETI